MSRGKIDTQFNDIEQVWNDFKNNKLLISVSEVGPTSFFQHHERNCNSNTKEQRKNSLQIFLSLFNTKYSQWNEEFEQDYLFKSDSLRKTSLIPTLDQTTAQKLSKYFEFYLNQFIENIRDDKTFHNFSGIEFIYLISLLLRKNENLTKFGNLSILIFPIINFLKLVQTLKNSFFVNIKGSDDPHDVEQIFIQLVIGNCLQILLYLTSPQGGWRIVNNNEKIAQKDDKIFFETKKELLKAGIFKIMKGFLDQLCTINIQTGVNGSLEDLQLLILNLIGSLYRDYPPSKTSTNHGILDSIVELLRWPDNLIAQNFTVTAANIPKLREEFKLQLTGLNVIKEAIDKSTPNAQRFTSLGGWEKVMDFILWATEIFSLNPILARSKLLNSREANSVAVWSFSKSESNSSSSFSTESDFASPPQIQRSKTREMQMLFDLIFAMTVGQKHEKRNKGHPDRAKLNINHTVLNIVIDLFNVDIRKSVNNERVRQKIINEYPELQIFALEYFTELIYFHSGTVGFLTQCRVWDALFSTTFYYCGVDEDLALLPEISRNDSERNYLFSKMRTQVLLFIEYVASIPGYDNMNICKVLLEILDAYYKNLDIIITISQSLSKIISTSNVPTAESLVNLDALTIIGAIIRDQQIQYSEVEVVDPKVEMARLSILNLLIKVLGRNPKFIHILLKNIEFVNTIFLLLYEVKYRNSALDILVIFMTVPTQKTSADFDDILFAYNQYFQIFHNFQLGSFDLTLLLLHGIRKITHEYKPSKSIFRKCGAFLNITTILNAETNSDRIPILCAEVLRTLTSLMMNNNKNKYEMKTNIGYDQLKNLIIQSLEYDKNESLSSELVLILFDMLVDGNFDENTKYTIQNPDVISLMFILVLSVPTKLVDELISIFTSIVRKSPRNQSLCCEKELIFTLLEIIQIINKDLSSVNKYTPLLEILGSHSITVKELKKQFLLMKSEPGDFRPLVQSRLLKALQYMALSRGKGPISFFDFDGHSSALSIPTIDKWPNTHGYTFCFWIRCDLYSTSSRKSFPRLISLLDKEGCGLEIFFCNNSNSSILLNIMICTPDKVATKEFSNFSLKDKRWYFITITHSNPRNLLRFGNDSEIKLYVNGDLKDKSIIRYPQFVHLTHNRIGSSVELKKNIAKANYNFSGQIGYILLFDGHMTNSQVHNLYQLCAEHAINKSGTACFNENETKIQLYYNCTARVENKFLDLTPEKNREKRLHAKKIGNLHTAITKDIKDIIHCIGGIKALLPIFAQLDQPIVPISSEDPINYSVDKQLLLQAIGLLGDMLTKSETNQLEMLRCQGFSVIGYLMQKSSPEHLTSETIFALEDLANKINFLPLYEDLWINIIFNWKIWIYSPPSVQWELMKLLHTISANKPEFIRKIMGIQKLLDVNYYYYWYDCQCTGAQGTESTYHPITKRLLGQRPKENELITLRKFNFDTIYELIREGISESEVMCILRGIIDTKDNLQVVELLDFMFNCLGCVSNFPDWIMNIGGLNYFVHMLKREEERVRINSLKMIGALFNWKKEREKEKERFFEFSSITKALSEFQLTEGTYQALLEIFVGSSFDPKSLGEENIQIQVPQILPVVFSLLPKAENALKEVILQDIYLLLNNNPVNREKILNIYGWQNWLLSYLETSDPDDFSNHVSYEFVFNIFKIMVLHSFRLEKACYKVLHQIFGFLLYYSSKNTIQYDGFGRILLSKILTTLISISFNTNKGSSLKDIDIRSPAFQSNLILIIGISDEFLYYSPSSKEISQLQIGMKVPSKPNLVFSTISSTTLLSSHFSVSGTWADFDLAKLVILVVDTFGLLLQNQSTHVIDQMVKESVKSSSLRPGGLNKIYLKIALHITDEGDKDICLEYIPKIRFLLEKEISNYKYASSEKVGYTLSSLLLTIKTTLSSSDNVAYDKLKVIIPFVKELIRVCAADLPTSPELQYFSESSTIREFIDNFQLPPLNLLITWADKKKTTISIEERAFASQIDKNRLKFNNAVNQYYQKEKKNDQVTEKKLEEDLQSIFSKILDKEIERKNLLCQKLEVDKKVIQRTWRNILRSLTNERAPWSLSESNTYWKLDRTENYSRMRIKLKRNYNFDFHSNASRDGMIEVAPKSEPNDNNEENFKLFSGIKLTEVDEENGDTVDIVDIVDESNPTNIIDNQDKVILSLYCELITPLKITVGKLELSNLFLTFIEDTNDSSTQKEKKIPIDRLREIHLRRYLHRRSGIEIFLTDRNNYFFNFKKKDRNRVYNKIISINPPNLTYYETGSLEQILKKSDLTRRWQMRLISNFDYLMQLNTIAGRSYNDITQYPVFPWILADYESESIDLNNPKIYRDLSKPIGALNPKRLEGFIVRYENFTEPDIPKFHYGSHYSSSGVVLFYLIRMEPFTTHFLKLQGGKFDHADRMFHSIPATWVNIMTNSSDVKELIPEFFYMPEFMANSNKFYFGTNQRGVSLGNVVLPPWANSAEEFVRINRAALESDYVSEHLHEWIDLIFGYKQKGKNAIEAYNVFYYLTYEGSIDIDAIEDEDKRRATEAQIDNFGQTPAQILRKPHPARFSLSDSHQSWFSKLINKLTPKITSFVISRDPIVFICNPSYVFNPTFGLSQLDNEILTIVDEERVPYLNRFLASTPSPNHSFTFELDVLATQRRKIGVSFATNLPITSQFFASSLDGKVLFSAGHWDYSIKLSWVSDNSKPIQSLLKHKDLVTCITIGSDGKYLVSGSRDTTLLVWELLYSKNTLLRIEENPLHILYGHNGEVTCVAVDSGLDICISGSNDGTCIIHNLQRGTYLRSLYHPNNHPISLVAISATGKIAFYSNVDLVLYIYSVNGDHICKIETNERITNILINQTSQYLVTGSLDGITIRYLCGLKVFTKIPTNSKITTMTMSSDESHLIVGLNDGNILLVSIDEKLKTQNCN